MLLKSADDKSKRLPANTAFQTLKGPALTDCKRLKADSQVSSQLPFKLLVKPPTVGPHHPVDATVRSRSSS